MLKNKWHFQLAASDHLKYNSVHHKTKTRLHLARQAIGFISKGGCLNKVCAIVCVYQNIKHAPLVTAI